MALPDDEEKQAATASTTTAIPNTPASINLLTVPGQHPTKQHEHGHLRGHVRERLGHFLHPNGKRIHVASSPVDAETLRKRLGQLHGDNSDDFDVYISGSPEHLDALRSARHHHEERREELRKRHQGVFDEFSNVHAELDALASELERVTTHGVSLTAHFSRFGYDAHVKSYDEDSSEGSGTTTPRTQSISEKKESAAERGFAVPLKLFVKPTIRQYFHKGILWRASGAEEVQSFELFVDLLYVGIIAVNADAASSDPTGTALLYFVITFTISYKIWNDMSLFISWFESDDIFTRVCILFLLATLFGYTTNITQAFETTYPTLIGFYLAARLFMGLYLLLTCFWVPMIRGVMAYHLAVIVVATALWIGSIHVPVTSGAQYALIFTAMFTDIFMQVSYVFIMRANSIPSLQRLLGKRLCTWIESHFEYVPAINIEHRVERMNAFVTLVFGYTVVAILYQSTRNGIDAFFGKAILGLTSCFIFNWIYFEVDNANLRAHAIRRHKVSAMVWALAHLPFIMAFVLSGGALARLVVAHDCADADPEALTEEYISRSFEVVPAGIRWFYCAGQALALALMAVISACHVHREFEGALRLPKWKRLMQRLAVALVILLLPLAGDKLNSLQLVATVTGMLIWLLSVELWASSSCADRVFGRDCAVTYMGRCGKKKFEAWIKEGDGSELDVDRLVDEAEREKGSGVTAAGH